MGLRVLALARRCLLGAVVLVAACGPIAYVQQVPFRAADAVARARAAHADKYSPYWWTRAVQYLHMAREVAGHADFQGANRFGRLAAEAAEKAEAEAEVGARDPSKLPYIDPRHPAAAPATHDGAPASQAPVSVPAHDAPASVPGKAAPASPPGPVEGGR